TKITNFGVFVELEQGLEGLLHISELADHKVDNPEEIVKVGQRVEVRIIKIDTEERKIGLTLIQAHFDESEESSAPQITEPERTQPALGSLASQLKGIGLRGGDDTPAAEESTEEPSEEPQPSAENPAAEGEPSESEKEG
ncbi:MAG: S1 RNA-binding domain-containing protein, partial [Planctomycetes bacterium]|nr:S1 RNA-binding domain-containing protein [Planctomycetota bacterium]